MQVSDPNKFSLTSEDLIDYFQAEINNKVDTILTELKHRKEIAQSIISVIGDSMEDMVMASQFAKEHNIHILFKFKNNKKLTIRLSPQ